MNRDTTEASTQGAASNARRSAGGAAASGGIGHEDRCLAWSAAYMLADERLPEWASGRRVVAVGAQTKRPVDDVAMVTDDGGWVTIQAKKRLKVDKRAGCPLGKALHQLVELDHVGVPTRPFEAEALRPVDPDRDLVLIWTDDAAPRTVEDILVPVVDRLRLLPDGVPVNDVTTNQREEFALRTVRDHLARSWAALHERDLSEADFRRLTKLMAVRTMRLSDGGPEWREALLLLRDLAQDPHQANQIWQALEGEAHHVAEKRLFVGRSDLVLKLENKHGFNLRPVARLRRDITRLQSRSSTNIETLVDKVTITSPEGSVAVPRTVQGAIDGADRNVAITGVPGAGKSVVLRALAKDAADVGADVVVLRSDDLQPTVGVMRTELNLTHDLGEVLVGWTGTGPGLILVDGLDQNRVADASRWLPKLGTQLSDSRWRIVATIRTFDLKHSPKWKAMFAGEPVPNAPADPELGQVRHIVVGDLTGDELKAVRTTSPRLARLLDEADPRLRHLLANPYNLDLAGQLLAESSADLLAVRSRVDLLNLYWRSRVRSRPEHVTREQALREIVSRILAIGRPSVNPVDLPGQAEAVVALRQDGVLRDLPGVPGSPVEQIAFAHQVLFDYAAAVLVLGDLSRAESLAEVLDNDPNLAITVRPSLEYRLAIAWRHDGSRGDFWRLVLRLASSTRGHLLVAHIATRVAAYEVDDITDLEELADACRGVSVDPYGKWGRQEASRVAFLLAAGISRHPEPAQPLNVLATFTRRLAQHARLADDVDRALLAAQLPRRAVNDPSLITAEEGVREWADVAVDSLSIALAGLDDPARAPLARVASWILAVVAAYEPDLVSDVVRAVIAPAGLEAWGIDAAWPLIERIPEIATAAPDMAVMIGASVWEYEETRDVSTQLLDSSILGMISNRKQDLESARYAAGRKFAELMDVDPVAACRLLLRIVERPRMYPWSPSRSFDRPPRLQVGSALTYSDGYHSLDKMVNTLIRGLERLAATSNGAAQEIVSILLAGLRHGEVWRRVLHDAARSDSLALGRLLLPVLQSPNVYAFPDSWLPAAHLAARLSPSLSDKQHRELETAILSAPRAGAASSDADEITQELAERTRTVLAALDLAKLGSSARAALEAGAQQPEALPNLTPALRDPYRFVPLEEEPPEPGSPEDLARIVEIAEKLSKDQDPQIRSEGIARLIDAWEAVIAIAVPSPEITDLRLRVAAVLATAPQVGPRTEVGEKVFVEFLSALPFSNSENPDSDTEWYAGDLPGYSATAATYAVQGVVRLFTRDDWHSQRGDELAGGVVPLLNSPSPVYRYLVSCILPILHPDAGDLIEALGRRLAEETDRHVANYLMAILARIRHAEPQHVDQVVGQLATLPRWAILAPEPQVDDEVGREDDDASIKLLTSLAVRYSTPHSSEVVGRWFEDPINYAACVKRSTTYLRDLLNPVQPQLLPAQERAFELLTRTLDQLRAAFAESLNGAEADSGVGDRGRRATEVAENLAAELYFASGAFDEARPSNEPTPRGDLARFAALALPMLDVLTAIPVPRITHHVVQTLSHISSIEPKRALLVTARAVTSDQAYARESTGLDTTLNLVRRYTAEHDGLIVTDVECTSAIRAMLESFVGLGWDKATQLLEELDDLFT